MTGFKVAVLGFLLAVPVAVRHEEKASASKVALRGNETLAEAVAALRAAGNDVADAPADATRLRLTAGTRDFWPALDEVCRQAHLQARLRNGRIELARSESDTGSRFVVYDGPFRAAITRRALAAFDDPVLDRLTLQVELACEPRMQPLVLKLPAGAVTWTWADLKTQDGTTPGVGSYAFEGEKARMFEVRLPRPDRTVKQIDRLTVQASVWLAAHRLEFETPLKAKATASKEETTFQVDEVKEFPAAKTWEVVTSLSYPAQSMEWESHQSGLVGNVTMTLTNGDRIVTSIGREVRTNESRRLEIRWLFRDVPGAPTAWRAKVVAPSAPGTYPLKLEFRDVPLP